MVKAAKWISTILAVFAGAGLAANNPRLVVTVAVLVGVITFAWSIIKDKSPDLDAVAIAVVLPSVLVSMNGKLASTLNGWLHNLWDWMFGWAGAWLGTESTFGMAATALALAWVLMKRADGGAGGMPSRIAGGGR